MKRLAIGAGAVAVGAGALTAVLVRQNRTFEAPYPSIHASSDPAVVARGRYLVNGPAHCVDCHGDPERAAQSAPGEDVPLSGGAEFKLPGGIARARNITSDIETGVGGARDEELARVLRYGVHRDGRAVLPFMPFAHLSDEDLTAVISFLRSQPPVAHRVAKTELNLLGRAVMAFVIEPRGPSHDVPARVTVAPTPEYGRYLANDVANCVGCHTNRDLRTGAFTGPMLGGGLELSSGADPAAKFVTPNLTPHPTDGWITSWDEETFVARFKLGGPTHPTTPMPWRCFAQMSDNDLRALYRYLREVTPVPGGPKPGTTALLISSSGKL